MRLVQFLLASVSAGACPIHSHGQPPTYPQAEARATWVTATDSDALATPAKTAETMHRLRDTGLNTVYVQVWKDGYTQYPSKVLQRTIGVDRNPALVQQQPADAPAPDRANRDLLQESLIEAHRNGLIYVAWFEFGFAIGREDLPNDRWKSKPGWLSRDIKGSEIAPDGTISLNPLHHEARRFMIDLVLEAANTYDLDGIMVDDRIAWPAITMGYDDYTKKAYAREHDGKPPPDDHTNEEWRRWRSRKVDEFSKQFVQELRAARPGLLVSLSPSLQPSSSENNCLDWPRWYAWARDDAVKLGDFVKASRMTPRWDEAIPKFFRFGHAEFERSWLDQVKFMNDLGAGRVKDMLPGIGAAGEGKDATWDDLRKSIESVRRAGAAGHAIWCNRGTIPFEPELAAFYNVKSSGSARHPKWDAGWRPVAIKLTRDVARSKPGAWFWQTASPEPALREGTYHIVVRSGEVWSYKSKASVAAAASDSGTGVLLEGEYDAAVLLRDRTNENSTDAYLGRSREPR